MARTHSCTELDEQPFTRFHWLALFTTGRGGFTDGHNLASIGLVLALVFISFPRKPRHPARFGKIHRLRLMRY
jgi:hypothetical protein